jgi:hypothetical protein
MPVRDSASSLAKPAAFCRFPVAPHRLLPPSDELALIFDLRINCGFKGRPILHARTGLSTAWASFVILFDGNDKTFGSKMRAAIVRRLETRFVVTGRVTERNQRIAKLREDGLPLAEIGALEGISRERVRQILLERQVLAQRAAVRRELGSLSLDEALSIRVDELGLSSRPANALKNDAITHVRDLIQMSEAEVLRMWRCARASLNEIKEVLALMGLHLAARRPWREAREYKPWWDHPTAE